MIHMHLKESKRTSERIIQCSKYTFKWSNSLGYTCRYAMLSKNITWNQVSSFSRKCNKLQRNGIVYLKKYKMKPWNSLLKVPAKSFTFEYKISFIFLVQSFVKNINSYIDANKW